MVGSLEFFPKSRVRGFDQDTYGLRLNRPIAPRNMPGDFGIEIELEANQPMPPRANFSVDGATWTVHADGSLRNGGLEYVLTEPASFDTAAAMVRGLYSELVTTPRLRLVLSNRTSVHVHYNVGGWKINRLSAMVALWGIVEDVLADWCGATRAGNLFCLRMRDAEWATDYWVKAFRTGLFGATNDYKYLAMNPAAIGRFGSLEFRTLRGCDEPETIIKWMQAIQRLAERAEAYADDPTRIAAEVSGLGGDGFVRDLFRGLPICDELVTDGYDVWAAVRRVQPILYALPWATLRPDIDRVHVPDPFAAPRPAARGRQRIAFDEFVAARDAIERAGR